MKPDRDLMHFPRNFPMNCSSQVMDDREDTTKEFRMNSNITLTGDLSKSDKGVVIFREILGGNMSVDIVKLVRDALAQYNGTRIYLKIEVESI